MLTKSDFTPQFCRQLIEEYGNKLNAATAVAPKTQNALGETASVRTVIEWMLHGMRLGVVGREETGRESRLEHLLGLNNIPLSEIGTIDSIKVGMWGVHAKDADGNVVTNVLDKTSVTIRPHQVAVAPAFPIVDKATSNIIQYTQVAHVAKKTWQCVIISDAQIGFLQDPETKKIEPIHDPVAIAIAKQITADVAPRKLAWIGDLMDWPFLSRWQQHDEFDAVNESIQAGYDHLCEFIAAAGPQVDQKIMVGSNHAKRPEAFLLEHNRKAMRIRRASDTSSWPVFSEPYLLRYDELGISFTGHYPGDEYFLLPDLLLTHAPPKANEFQASVIHGHTHHLTRSTRVQHSHAGRQTYFVYDTGCLCQTGSTSNTHRLLRTLTPSDRARTDWAQGISVVNVVDGKFPKHSVDQISILNGHAIYQGQIYGHK
jgi:hypothetical protein